MTLFELHTNEGRRIVRSTVPRLREAMRGYPLAVIVYCWSPVYPETI